MKRDWLVEECSSFIEVYWSMRSKGMPISEGTQISMRDRESFLKRIGIDPFRYLEAMRKKSAEGTLEPYTGKSLFIYREPAT